MRSRKYLQQRLRSFQYAINGILLFLRSEPHARIHLLATVVVILAGFYCRLTATEWISVLIVTGLVWITEMINTVIEKIMDHLSPQYHPQVKWIKDVAAGAVLLAVGLALIVGGVIFLGYIF